MNSIHRLCADFVMKLYWSGFLKKIKYPTRTAFAYAKEVSVWVQVGLVLIIAVGVGSCHRGGSAPLGSSSTVDVYLAGQRLNKDSSLRDTLRTLAVQRLSAKVTLQVASLPRVYSYEEMGFGVDETALSQIEKAFSIHLKKTPFLATLPIRIHTARARAFLLDLKQKVDVEPSSDQMDLENHQIFSGEGRQLDVDQSIVGFQYEARRLSYGGQPISQLNLSVQTVPPTRSLGLRTEDISHVLGTYKTPYKSGGEDTNRTFNLKLGAARLNGYILGPNAIVSVNAVVGPRTLDQGFRVASVIEAGEMIEGDGGGMCQVSTTLHAAAFFAGLDIVDTKPHSRPSVYIAMGMDSTVVYPVVDLKIRNPYSFPVVIHYTMSQNVATVEILGKERPFQVMFERKILSRLEYETVWREDPTMPKGQEMKVQAGYPGYRFLRRRYAYKGPDPITNKDGKIQWAPTTQCFSHAKGHNWQWEEQNSRSCPIADEWERGYLPTTEYMAAGTGDPVTVKKKAQVSTHAIRPIPANEEPFFYIRQ